MKEKVMHEINQRKVAIHCPTQEEANKLYNLLGKKIYSDRWTSYEADTCFFYYDGTYGNIAWTKENNYKILTAEYVLSALQPTHPIQVGDTYKNSAGKLCSIKEITSSAVWFKHEDGQRYKTTIDNITRRWTKQTSPTKEQPMIANLQPGTKVRVRPDLKNDGTDYYMANKGRSDTITDTMLTKAGTIVTIKKLYYSKYLLQEVGEFWTDEMFSEIISLPDEEQPKVELDSRRNLAFYKRSGEPWTEEETLNIYKYCGDIEVCEKLPPYKYIFDNGSGNDEFMFSWSRKETHPNFSNCKQVAYEDIFEPPKPEPARRSVKPKCSLEPTTIPTQKDNFMTKFKNTALVTVDQNKEALIIASKMEAGRIINKQILKQLSPHLPFFLQGYTKSPLAPIVAANLVAMVANHTQNQKLSKVAELMLLGAADSGVASFNLDKIVDDILAGIKLPKGVLDTDEE